MKRESEKNYHARINNRIRQIMQEDSGRIMIHLYMLLQMAMLMHTSSPSGGCRFLWLTPSIVDIFSSSSCTKIYTQFRRCDEKTRDRRGTYIGLANEPPCLCAHNHTCKYSLRLSLRKTWERCCMRCFDRHTGRSRCVPGGRSNLSSSPAGRLEKLGMKSSSRPGSGGDRKK